MFRDWSFFGTFFLLTFHERNPTISGFQRGMESRTEGKGEGSPSLAVSDRPLLLCRSTASWSGCQTGTWPEKRPNHRTQPQDGIFCSKLQQRAASGCDKLTSMRFLLRRSLFLSRNPAGEKKKSAWYPNEVCLQDLCFTFWKTNTTIITCLFTAKANFGNEHYVQRGGSRCFLLFFDFDFSVLISVPIGEKFGNRLSTDELHLTIDIIIDLSSIMQQPELLPAHHPAGFSICELMAERDRKMHCQLFVWRKRRQKKKKLENILRDKVRVAAQRVFQFFQKRNVAGLAGSQAFFILQWWAWFLLVLPVIALWSALITTHLAYQNGNYAFVLLLYQVTDDFVVKVLHRLPLRHNIWRWKFDKLGGK